MIRLTRLGGEVFVLNADLIRYVECRPDTFITLTTGERLVVLETFNLVSAHRFADARRVFEARWQMNLWLGCLYEAATVGWQPLR